MLSQVDDERREEALELAQEIWKVRAHLKALEERFDLLLLSGHGGPSRADTAPPPAVSSAPGRGPLPPRPPSSPPTKSGAGDDFADEDDEDEDSNGDEDEAGSGAARVLAIFQRRPGVPIQIQDVVDVLDDIEPKSIRTNAARFARSGKLQHVRRGVYMYPAALANGGAH